MGISIPRPSLPNNGVHELATGPETHFVVGSGPTGVACAQALANAGRSVTILDSGLTLEADREQARAALAGRDAGDWTAADADFLRARIAADGKVPLKLSYGSDYPYRPTPGATDIVQSGLTIRGSHAAGGLSNVWGSAILPYRQEDINDWPITAAELERPYAEVLKFMPIAAQKDGLAEFFPLFSEDHAPLPPSRQAARLLKVLEENRGRLNRSRVFFGGSRLAVDAAGARSRSPCVACALCLHSCPHGLIYSSQQTLADLRGKGKIRYIDGLTVNKVEESANRVDIHAVDTSGRPHKFQGERVFLASGVINTTSILLRSLNQYDRTVHIKDSQYFLLPALQLRGTSGVVDERLHTLCQAFVDIFDPALSAHTVHLQLYTYNDLFRALLKNKLGPLTRLMPESLILGRLLLFQAYLHSSHSGQIAATLKHRSGSDALHLKPILNPETKNKVSAVVRKLRRLIPATQVLPVSPLLEITEPGRGFHSGGSFPMSQNPGPGECDRWGRPFGLSRTHAVDATVFPTIPATTITFTAMANAYRIGDAVSADHIRGDG